MTVAQLLEKGKSLLKENNIENYANEARWIFEAFFECGREYLVFHSEDETETEKTELYLELIKQRASGVPVQYVIGSWDFYGETFSVGEGVLIPRPETEMLVDFAVDYLKNKTNSVIVDLCSGTGFIGLSVAKTFPDSKVFLVEKSEKAFEYLKINLENFGCKNLTAINGDIFEGFESFGIPEPDLILSNPPYHADFSVAKAFIEDGYKGLVLGGKLMMVTKRLPWYRNKMTSVFGGVKVYERDGYYVFVAEKRRRTERRPEKKKQELSKKLNRKYRGKRGKGM